MADITVKQLLELQRQQAEESYQGVDDLEIAKEELGIKDDTDPDFVALCQKLQVEMDGQNVLKVIGFARRFVDIFLGIKYEGKIVKSVSE